jgi:hypothetical protein
MERIQRKIARIRERLHLSDRYRAIAGSALRPIPSTAAP